MASLTEPVPHTDVLPPASKTVRCEPSQMNHQRSPSPGSDTIEELGASQRDVDSISIDSTQSYPDHWGRMDVTFDDERTETVYEAWELSSIEDTYTRQSWTSFWGINLGTRWKNQNNGCVLLSTAVSFGQGELADMHEDAVCGYKYGQGASQEKAYEQDLANRTHDLPSGVYNTIHHLIEDKTIATNKQPYRKREWRVAVLQPDEFRMTELLPERKRKNLFSRAKEPTNTIRTWLVVLRAQEVKSTKEDGGWKGYNRFSNPWWRLDLRETKEERSHRKDIMKRLDRADAHRRQHDRPPHRPHHIRPRGGPLPM